jgi:hypothetical protein
MATRLPAKSILKQTPPASKPTLSDEEKAKAERDRRNLSIALHHANRIQQQKDVQAQILSNIETLLDYPATENPTAAESSQFVSLVQPFQPSDFDSLVEERRINKKCGYALCSNAPRAASMGASAAWKLKGEGAEDYCSNDCLRKALYVKSQLSEVPAWEREPGQQPQIVLEGGDATCTADSTAHHHQDRGTTKDELAHERGETASSFRPGQVMTSNVVEKATVVHKPGDTAKSTPSSHTAIEGYEPTMGFEQQHLETNQPDIDDMIVDRTSSHANAPVADSDEREAWRDLFDNIDKR